MNKKTLESLVPPPQLCYDIGVNDFADSALVWNTRCSPDKILLIRREEWDHGGYITPAPTLAEIMDALANEWQCPNLHLHKSLKLNRIVGYVTAGLDASRDIDNDTSATAALKLWLEMNEEEKSEKNG